MEDVQEVNDRCCGILHTQRWSKDMSATENLRGSLKVGEWRALGGGVFSLSQVSFSLLAFWHVSTEIV
jgi:hypothetical protein